MTHNISKKPKKHDDSILIICHLTGSKCDGQETKTKDTIKFLEKHGFTVDVFNYGKLNTFSKIIRSMQVIHKYKRIVIMPGGMNALMFFSLFFRKKQDIHYMTIGGWIIKYFGNSKYSYVYKKMKNFKGIYLQNRWAVQLFENKGFTNVFYVSNFSSKPQLNRTDFEKSVHKLAISKEIRFCYFARICREKGIFLACDAIAKINETTKYNVKLDVFGKEDSPSTLIEMEKYNKYVRYMGTISGEDVTQTLSSYYSLLFPTFYPGEGTPHSIIEAFMSGLPVIASDWMYNPEIVDNYKTGLIFSLNTNNDLVTKMLWMIENKEKMLEMRTNCFRTSKFYSSDVLLKGFLERIR